MDCDAFRVRDDSLFLANRVIYMMDLSINEQETLASPLSLDSGKLPAGLRTVTWLLSFKMFPINRLEPSPNPFTLLLSLDIDAIKLFQKQLFATDKKKSEMLVY